MNLMVYLYQRAMGLLNHLVNLTYQHHNSSFNVVIHH